METRKLYYEDCHLWDFSAKVLTCEKMKKGYLITLDATAFYPEGGGQACDLGALGNVNVLDVQERGEEVVHLCDGPLSAGEAVEGHIDGVRRFDQMQQHTGEHIVSGIVFEMFGYHNVGFHVGKEVMEVDFDGPVPAGALVEIETRANWAVWANAAIRCWTPSEEELPTVGYRTKKELPWPVRIVEIPGTDKCACCAVHVERTGEVGLIKILSCVKFHQGVRMEIICGARALRHVQQVCEQNRQVSQAFSAKLMETGTAARRMNEVLAAEKFRSTGLEKRLFRLIAESYVNQVNVVHFEQGLTGAAVRELADTIADVVSGTAAVFSGEEGAYSFCLVSRHRDVRPLGKALTASCGGRGGGKPEAFQGTVKASKAEIGCAFDACK